MAASELSSLKFRETLAPEGSYTFQLTIENKANANDKFTLSATSVPSGWRVLFINGNVFEVEAGRTLSVPIRLKLVMKLEMAVRKVLQFQFSVIYLIKKNSNRL